MDSPTLKLAWSPKREGPRAAKLKSWVSLADNLRLHPLFTKSELEQSL